MARNRRSARGGSTVTVNMKGVDTKRPVLPEDDYPVALAEASIEDGDAAKYIKWVFEVVGGKFEGTKLYYNTSLAPQALFNLRGLLEALGEEVPNDEMDIDLKDLVGAEMTAVVGHDRYQGKLQSKIVDFYPADGKKEPRGDKDDEKPRRSRSEDDEDKTPRRSRSRDEDDKPRGRNGDKPRRGKKEFEPIAAEEVEEMKQRELEDLVEEAGLDLELTGTLTKMRNAVIDALGEAELLAE